MQDKNKKEGIELVELHQRPPNFSNSKHTSNAFSRNISKSQISAYLLVCLEIIVFFLCMNPFIQNLIILSFYVISGVVFFVSAAISQCSDPTDKVVYHYKWSRHNKLIAFDD